VVAKAILYHGLPVAAAPISMLPARNKEKRFPSSGLRCGGLKDFIADSIGRP
jgi:hypothetical protein